MTDNELNISDLPGEDASSDELRAFAGDFDGYGAAGGLHEAAGIARAPSMDSITEMRIAKYFAVRAMRHCDDDFGPDEPAQFREYVARIREILLERERTSSSSPRGKSATKDNLGEV